jgi:hypothetical protein
MNFRRACWVVALGASSVTCVAAADGAARVSLSWSAPSECRDELELTRRIETLVGRSLRDAGEQSLSVAASAQGDSAHGYAAKVTFSSPQGSETRYLEHPRCDHLLQAVALLIALAIDPERVRAAQPQQALGDAAAQSSVHQAQPSAVPESTPKREAPALAPAAQSPSLRGARIAVHGLLGAGALPDFGVGLGVTLGYHRRSFRAELAGRYWVPRERIVSSSPSASIELRLTTLGGRGCWLPRLGAWQLAACAGADLGPMSAEGQGLQNPRPRDGLYAAVVGGVGLTHSQWRISPELGLEISGALARPPFGVVENGNGTEKFRPAGWGFSAFAGLAFEL